MSSFNCGTPIWEGNPLYLEIEGCIYKKIKWKLFKGTYKRHLLGAYYMGTYKDPII